MLPTTDFQYPVSSRALPIWARNNLEVTERGETTTHFRYTFRGSTCSNGGTAFVSYVHVVVAHGEEELTVEGAWIEIPDTEAEGIREMCAYKTDGDTFLDSLKTPPSFCGRALEEALTEERPLNHAGCFCTAAMKNQKWLMVLSTVHYYLANQT